MQLPPNMGMIISQNLKLYFLNWLKKSLDLIPFLLKDVGGIPSLNQADGIHPTVKGHKIVANNVWEVLKPVLSL